MMQDNIDISELYDSGAISGETYLYCVEHDLNTIQDLSSCNLNDASELVLSELTEFMTENQSIVAGYSEIENNDTPVLCESSVEYSSVLDRKIEHLDSDVRSFVDRLIHYYGDKQILLENLRRYNGVDSIPNCEGVEDNVINALLDLAYDLQMYGRQYSLFEEIFSKCNDVRSTNVLKARYESFGNKLEFVHWILTCKSAELCYLKNCGRKSCGIIWGIIKEIRELAKHDKPNLNSAKADTTSSERIGKYTEDDVLRFKLLVESKRELLSVRAANVLDGIIEHCHGSYDTMLGLFLSSDFLFFSFRNCGRKTNHELMQFKQELLTLMSSSSVEDLEQETRCEQYRNRFSLPKESVQEIIALEDELGYFPLFNTIQHYIDYLPNKDYSILHGMLDIYNGQELRHRDDIGKELNLTGERVRQLRDKVLRQLRSYILSIDSTGDMPQYTPHKSDEINYKERTNFQDNFIYWTISLVNKNWILLGDIEEVFYNPHGHQVNLNILPAVLANVYDFKRFVKYFNKLYIEKRTIASELNLQSFCMKFFSDTIQIALLDDIIYECKKIILRLYDCTTNGDIVILESNAYRGLGDICEEILREHGTPMTAEEIYSVLLEKYPNQRCKGTNSLVGSIHNNSNIKPLGRSRTYALTEWNVGTMRGGTIREFAEEYILMQSDRIASLEDIGDYVRQFRSTSSNSSIQANLMLEASGKFALFTKEDQKYIGFAGREYDLCYVPAEESMIIVRSFETSTKLLIQFIEENGRYPFSTGDDVPEPEKRLWRFLRNVRYRCKNGTGTTEDYEFIKYLESAYPYQEIPRNEYKWRETHNTVCKTLHEYGRDALTPTEQQWCYKYLRMLKQGQLEDWQVPLMIKLQSLYA